MHDPMTSFNANLDSDTDWHDRNSYGQGHSYQPIKIRPGYWQIRNLYGEILVEGETLMDCWRQIT